LYHKVGYLITIGVNIKDILIKKEGETKTGFIELINKKIEEEIKDIDLEQLKYGDNRVRKLLLLHNVQTMLNNKNETSRFPFYRYKIERWDVEHIHAIASNVKVKEEDQAKWLKNNFIKTDEPQKKNNFDKMCIQIEKIINSGKSTTKENFSKIIDFVLGKEDNSLQNLCLLDSSTNRSYKNDSFKEKRRKIIERELEGTFIPICTKNVFMKYYTNDVKSIEIWNEDDRNSYFNNIEEVTKKYLPQTE
jgi:hypothetical protein